LNGAREVVSRIEELGGCLAVDSDGCIRYRLPKGNPEAQALLDVIKSDKPALLAYLQERQGRRVHSAPPGTRLLRWNLKDPPVAIESCSIVIDTAKFADMTLAQLGIALANPKRWVGWTVPQLLDRLAQVGVILVLERKGQPTAHSQTETEP